MPSNTYVSKGTLFSSGVTNSDGRGPKAFSTITDNNAVWRYVSSSGAKTTGFRNPNRQGPLKPLPYTLAITEYRYSEGWENSYDTVLKPTDYTYRNIRTQGCFGSTEGFGNISIGTDTAIRQKLTDQATQKVLTKLKNTSADMAVAMGEAGQTAGMITKTVVSVAGAITHLKRGDIGGAADAIGYGLGIRARRRFNREYARDAGKAVASGWLALQYGWKPLLNDVYGLVDELARHQLNAMVVTTSAEARRITPIALRESSKAGKCTTTKVAAGETLDICKVSVTYYRPVGGARTAKETGLLNPANVAWELLPYSFVVDWFLPIGPWLNTFDATAGLTFLHGYQTNFHKGAVRFTTTREGIDNYSVYQNWFKVSSESNVNMVRTPLSGFPSPVTPSFKNPATLGHFANGMALLTAAVFGTKVGNKKVF